MPTNNCPACIAPCNNPSAPGTGTANRSPRTATPKALNSNYVITQAELDQIRDIKLDFARTYADKYPNADDATKRAYDDRFKTLADLEDDIVRKNFSRKLRKAVDREPDWEP